MLTYKFLSEKENKYRMGDTIGTLHVNDSLWKAENRLLPTTTCTLQQINDNVNETDKQWRNDLFH